ncbi:nucleotide-sugar epimerase [Histomonas meleagridis]|uniref:nucleotide-sugar epimerase n=1 Tax=Histomonas meleagridis TaxID=135588 RepID=UPI00355968BA|nr:nucleotide-sugar epimerase [Histomonas meleagridis]KAH0800380.1 nucleotide-sugar epimerase [Histomonas meleagridis]
MGFSNQIIIFIYLVLSLLVISNVILFTRIKNISSFPYYQFTNSQDENDFNVNFINQKQSVSLITGEKLKISADGCIDRNNYKLNFLIPFGLDPLTHKDTDEYVLILGTGGLIGSELKEALIQRGYKVLHVLSRHHLDLRIPYSLDIFSAVKIKFAYFLSYEVGGSKFLHIPELQSFIRESNIRLQTNVFNWLVEHKIRFIFSTTSLSKEKNLAYGYAKTVGENFIRSVPELGRVVRFWNVYGFEYVGSKSHVVSDLLVQCLTKGYAKLLTNGKESLQFVHTSDVVNALILILENFEKTPLTIDITDGVWTPLTTMIKSIKRIMPNCRIDTTNKSAKPRFLFPHNFDTYFHKNLWHAKLSIDEGIKATYEKTLKHLERSKNVSTLSVIIDCGNEIDDNIIKLLNIQVEKLKELSEEFIIFTLEIIATTKSLSVHRKLPLPCTVMVNKDDNYIDEAIEYAHSNAIMVIDYYTLPSYGHFDFFHRELTVDYIIYYADNYNIKSLELTTLRTKPTSTAGFNQVNKCGENIIKKDVSLLVATKKTWKTLGFPPKNCNINQWMMQLEHGFTAVRYEEPAWNARYNNLDDESYDNSKLGKVCCNGKVIKTNMKCDAKKANTFVFLNQ